MQRTSLQTMVLTLMFGTVVTLYSESLFAQQAPEATPRGAQPSRQEALSDQPQDSIALTVWILTIGDSAEPPSDEASANFASRVQNLSEKFASAEEVQELIGRLKVASMLRSLREIRLTTLNGKSASTQTGRLQPRIVATQISPWQRRTVVRPEGRDGAIQPDTDDSMVMNSVTNERIGTIIEALPRIDSSGAIQISLKYESSEVEKSPEVVLSEVPGRKPMLATRVVVEQLETSLRLKSGTAVLVRSDASQVMTGDSPTSETQLLILAASAEPALE